jgi:hypothetical protein
VRKAVDEQRLPDASSIAKQPSSEPRTQDDDGIGRRIVVTRREGAALGRLSPEDREDAADAQAAANALGGVVGHHDPLRCGETRHCRKARGALHPVVEVARRSAVERITAIGAMTEHDDRVRIGERQGAHQHGMDHAEHGGIGADGKRHGRQRDAGEPGRAAQQPCRVSPILKQRANHPASPFERCEMRIAVRDGPPFTPAEPQQRGDFTHGDTERRAPTAARAGVAEQVGEDERHLVAVPFAYIRRQQVHERAMNPPGEHALPHTRRGASIFRRASRSVRSSRAVSSRATSRPSGVIR